jgi:hypothetical protein
MTNLEMKGGECVNGRRGAKKYVFAMALCVLLFFPLALMKKVAYTVPEDALIQLSGHDDYAPGTFIHTVYNKEKGGIELLFSEGTFSSSGFYISPPLAAGFSIREIIPSWNVETPPGCGILVELRLSREGEHWSPWLSIGNWGHHAIGGKGEKKNEWGEVKVDYVTVKRDAAFAQFRLTLWTKDDTKSPLARLVTLALSDQEGDLDIPLRKPLSSHFSPGPLNLKVPYRSQRREDPSIAGDICSTTSVSMVMEYWGVKRTTQAMANIIYEPETKLYGIWWRAVQAASQFGLTGWVRYFRNWEEVYGELTAGHPVIACISFDEGALSGSPTSCSEGHVIVVRGFDGKGNPLCNDPAGIDERDGVIVYNREELARAWFDKGGVGYLILPRGTP